MNVSKKTGISLFWSSIERFSVQILQFILGIILARILTPSDFGLIGMLTIFVAVSQIILDAGFTMALIQKKDRTETDYFPNPVIGYQTHTQVDISKSKEIMNCK